MKLLGMQQCFLSCTSFFIVLIRECSQHLLEHHGICHHLLPNIALTFPLPIFTYFPFVYGRSAARWQDLVLTLHWLLDNYPNGEEQFLWDMAELVQQQVSNE